MSGTSYGTTCFKCGNEMDCYSDWKPYDMSSGQCLHCGFQYWTEEGQMTLEEVNQIRIDADLEPLEKLADQKN